MPSPSPRSLHRFLLFFFFLRVEEEAEEEPGFEASMASEIVTSSCNLFSSRGVSVAVSTKAMNSSRPSCARSTPWGPPSPPILSSSGPRAPSPPATERGGRRGLQRPRPPRLPHQPETAWRAAASRPLRSAAVCGHFSAARAPAGCTATPLVEGSSVPVGRQA